MGSTAAKRIVGALLLCLAGVAVSGLLMMQHHGETAALTAVNELCGDGETSGCEDVARSSWSAFAGVPVAAYGVLLYGSLALALLLALLSPGELRNPLAGLAAGFLALGLLIDLALLALQAFVIHAYCELCILTYVISLLALALLWFSRRSLGDLAPALSRPDGRLALGAWALGSLTLLGGILAADFGLEARAERRQATLLGGPTEKPAATPTATPEPVATPLAEATSEDAKVWQKRALELQATLDDPARLEAYFTAKARQEYETAAVAKIDLSHAPGKGPAKAPVTVVEYSDFLCPFCRNLALALSQFVSQAEGRVVVHFKNFPLDASCNTKLKHSTHPGACNLALGGVCAHAQGRFEAYHDKVFKSELKNPQPADVVRLAVEAGLSESDMQSCMNDAKAKATLAAEIDEGNRLGVSATPTVYVNGKKLPRINDFVAIVDKEAQKKGFAPLAK